MSRQISASLRYLDPCLPDFNSVARLKNVIASIERCCQALQRDYNLADILNDPGNQSSLAKAFGEEYDVGLQLVLKLALRDYEHVSTTLYRDIDGAGKLDFLHRSIGGWKQFDIVIAFHAYGQDPLHTIFAVNPMKREQWMALERVRAGTVANVYVRTKGPKRSTAQEELAAERIIAIFQTVQSMAEGVTLKPEPVVEFGEPAAPQIAVVPQSSTGNGARPASRAPGMGSTSGVKAKARSTAPSFKNFSAGGPAVSSTPVQSLKIRINKMDVFVHAGNAHLIMTHLKDYQGRVEFFALRDKKQKILLDADSIWSAEVRNGETVLFEFFGVQPSEDFLKELAKKVNKYTQMDKMGE